MMAVLNPCDLVRMCALKGILFCKRHRIHRRENLVLVG